MTALTPPSIGNGRCFIIGEVALTHDGSLGLAHAFIDAIAAAGADAVKFQTHIAAAESTPAEPFRVPFSRQDTSRYGYWERTGFAEADWGGLADHCRDRGVQFISSPFSVEAVDLLERIGQPFWKVPSGETGNRLLLDRMIATRLPVVLSTGMSGMAEIDAAVERVRAGGCTAGVLQCTTAYPCPPERVGLNVIPGFRSRYAGCWVGLSDHSATIYAGLAAATVGIDILEIHVTLSREMFGPDVPASVTTGELRQLVDGVRFIERMVQSPVDKDLAAESTRPLKAIFTRSIVARGGLPAGHRIDAADLAFKKPGTGLPPDRAGDVIGRTLARAVAADELIREEDLA
ncbi:MAG: N-acetylneuraminate synthase [Acidimicrobiia bacterium]|nr:N-acetylneuraminate synthase [Acidimicrobiia bacterium]